MHLANIAFWVYTRPSVLKEESGRGDWKVY